MICTLRSLFVPASPLLAAVCISVNAWGQPPREHVSVDHPVRTRSELAGAVSSARPGATIVIAPGIYEAGLSFRDVRGSEEHPIVLRGSDPNDPPVFRGGGSGLHLSRCEHLELRNLVFERASGNGLNIDDGGNPDHPSHHIVLRRLQIRDVGPSGNRDGVKLSGVDQFLIDSCVVQRWGSSGSAIDMVGCHQGRIEGCRFEYRSELAANGVQTKGGSSDIMIQHCRFENAGGRAVNIGGSTGQAYFRPRSAGYEAKNITVQDCTLIGSMAPIAFVGVDGAVVQHNTIYQPTRWVMRILQESQGPEFISCRNGIFRNNLVVFRSDQLRSVVNIGVGTSPETFQFRDNHWYCVDRPQRSRPSGLPTPESGGTYGVKPSFVDEAKLDLRLTGEPNSRSAGARSNPSR